MESKKGVRYYMRALHRDLGFVCIGLVLVYALSGIVLVFRDTHFMKKETVIEQTLPTELDEEQLGKALKLRKFKVVANEGNIISFNEGSYNRATGETRYTITELRSPFDRMVRLHMLPSKSNAAHWISVLIAVILSFLAISSFWMFNPKAKPFKRGMIFAAIGLLGTILLLCFI